MEEPELFLEKLRGKEKRAVDNFLLNLPEKCRMMNTTVLFVYQKSGWVTKLSFEMKDTKFYFWFFQISCGIFTFQRNYVYANFNFSSDVSSRCIACVTYMRAINEKPFQASLRQMFYLGMN